MLVSGYFGLITCLENYPLFKLSCFIVSWSCYRTMVALVIYVKIGQLALIYAWLPFVTCHCIAVFISLSPHVHASRIQILLLICVFGWQLTLFVFIAVGWCVVMWCDTLCYAGWSIPIWRPRRSEELQENHSSTFTLEFSRPLFLIYPYNYIHHLIILIYQYSCPEDNGCSVQDPWLRPCISRL